MVAVATHLEMTGGWLIVGGGGVWLTDRAGIARLDPATGARVAQVPIPEGACEGTAAGLGAVWTATCGAPGVDRIDPYTDRVVGRASFPAGTVLDSQGTVGVGAGSVWVVVDRSGCSGCRVARIDAHSLRVTAWVPVAPGAVSVRFGFGSAWVANPQKNLVQQVDPASDRVVGRIDTQGAPSFCVVGEGAVWTLDLADGTVTRIDPHTGRGAVIHTGMSGIPGGGGDLSAGGGWVWALSQQGLLLRIDPRRNDVAETYGPPSGGGDVAVGDGAVWLSTFDLGSVWRLPLTTVGQPQHRLTFGR